MMVMITWASPQSVVALQASPSSSDKFLWEEVRTFDPLRRRMVFSQMYEWLLLDNTIENLGWTSKLVMRKETDARVRTWGKERIKCCLFVFATATDYNWNCLVLVGRYSLPKVHRAEVSSTTCKNTFKVATELWSPLEGQSSKPTWGQLFDLPPPKMVGLPPFEDPLASGTLKDMKKKLSVTSVYFLILMW